MPETETEPKNEITTTKQCLRVRPLWQRMVYPIIGGILIILGVIVWIMPVIPGFPLDNHRHTACGLFSSAS